MLLRNFHLFTSFGGLPDFLRLGEQAQAAALRAKREASEKQASRLASLGQDQGQDQTYVERKVGIDARHATTDSVVSRQLQCECPDSAHTFVTSRHRCLCCAGPDAAVRLSVCEYNGLVDKTVANRMIDELEESGTSSAMQQPSQAGNRSGAAREQASSELVLDTVFPASSRHTHRADEYALGQHGGSVSDVDREDHFDGKLAGRSTWTAVPIVGTAGGTTAEVSASMQLRDAELSAMMTASSSFDFEINETTSLRVESGADDHDEEDELEGSREHGPLSAQRLVLADSGHITQSIHLSLVARQLIVCMW